jgi:trehalose 6-phosphate synthase
MDETITCGLPEMMWRRMAQAPSRLLMLDYDGTLAPFHVERMQARPAEATLQILRDIIASDHTRVVLVSGRPAEEVATLVDGLAVTIVGAHGFERFEHLEGTRQSTLTTAEMEGLTAAAAAARATGQGARVEEKPASVALHTRGLSPEESREAEEFAWKVWSPIAERYNLECRPLSGGVEIRSRHYHKGIAVETLLEEMPVDVFAVYIGDDDTDEDAFTTLAGRGAAIKVGSLDAQSAAPWRLAHSAAVCAFLEHWHDVAATGSLPELETSTRSRLVVVSNRLPSFDKPEKKVGKRKAAGGLASAVTAALKQTDGGMWVGWSGKTRRQSEAMKLAPLADDPVPVYGLDLSDREVEAYYNGFCNHSLWPLLHSFQNYVELSTWELEVYRNVNQGFAQSLRPLLTDDDMVWVHDYHLIPVGDELKRIGYRGLLGFFLHVPFPSLDFLKILPEYTTFIDALFQYDLIGFHTRTYLDNYIYACTRVLDAEWDGKFIRARGRAQRAGVYPAGIDVERFQPQAEPVTRRTRKGSVRADLKDRRVVIGVDRLDYTKGIPERILAFEHLLRIRPDLVGNISLLQICAPSRTRVPEYMEQKRNMDSLVGRLNAELGERDWEPIRYLYKSYPQSDLAEFYRESDVGLVTPLRDGMNLVAKEFVAAQRPDDPGVLVLSRFAGASEELVEAVIVNPYLPEGCAKGIALALSMPLEERIERHQAMLAKVEKQTARKWAADFLSDLKSCRRSRYSL